MKPIIRPYHPSDLAALYRICLLTGDSGKDATAIYNDPDILGQLYAAPYAVYEPDLCFVLTCLGNPCGYILGTRDSATFYKRCEKEWFPVLRERYPRPDDADMSADARITRIIHSVQKADEDMSPYPAHLHIDLLPEAQGQGMGRKLINTFLDKLRALEVPGVHLGVGKANTNAVGFYKRLGFELVKELEASINFGMSLK